MCGEFTAAGASQELVRTDRVCSLPTLFWHSIALQKFYRLALLLFLYHFIANMSIDRAQPSQGCEHTPAWGETRKEKRERLAREDLENQKRFAEERLKEMASSSSNVVGVHYRVGKKIGEGSFGVIFEGTNLLNNQQVAIKFVRVMQGAIRLHADVSRNQGRAMRHNYETNTEHTRYLWAAVGSRYRNAFRARLTGISWYT